MFRSFFVAFPSLKPEAQSVFNRVLGRVVVVFRSILLEFFWGSKLFYGFLCSQARRFGSRCRGIVEFLGCFEAFLEGFVWLSLRPHKT